MTCSSLWWFVEPVNRCVYREYCKNATFQLFTCRKCRFSFHHLCGNMLNGSEDGLCRQDCDGTPLDAIKLKKYMAALEGGEKEDDDSTKKKSNSTNKRSKDTLFSKSLRIHRDANVLKPGDPDYPPTQPASEVQNYLNTLTVSEYIFKPGDLVIYGESVIEEHHRLGVIESIELDDGETFLHIKFQLVGAPPLVFHLDPLKLQANLAVPLDEYRLHDGKRFFYYGPPPRSSSSHPWYIGVRCAVNGKGNTISSANLNPKELSRLYVGDMFLLKNPGGGLHQLWCMIVGFIRNEITAHEWHVLVHTNYTKEQLQQHDILKLDMEKHIFFIQTSHLLKLFVADTEYIPNKVIFKIPCWCFKQVSYCLRYIENFL